MNRGEIWTVSGSGEFTNKPRPCLILQNDNILNHDSFIVAVLTSDLTKITPFRYLLTPDKVNGLQIQSIVMVDKLKSIKVQNFGKYIGVIDAENLEGIEDLLVFILDLDI